MLTNSTPTPVIEELGIALSAAVYWKDAEADAEHPDPTGYAMELLAEAQAMYETVIENHNELLASLRTCRACIENLIARDLIRDPFNDHYDEAEIAVEGAAAIIAKLDNTSTEEESLKI